ncbi:MAG: site-specific DNA-methyltransferase [Pseudomonadota bacterium]
MATGVSKHERMGLDAVSAFESAGPFIPLPSDSAEVSISYSGKTPESEILRPVDTSFVELSSGTSKLVDEIAYNSFVWGDNLLTLSFLYQTNVKARLIYLDPPYGTGMDFHSRELDHAYSDDLGPAAYMEFMRRRLILCRECLADDGSIYVHIGHQHVATIKLLLDEIFGASNFRSLIARRKCSSKNFTRKQYSNLNDYVLFYSKNKTYVWNQPGTKPDQDWIEKEYPKIDGLGRRFKLVPVHAPGTRNGETGKEWRGKLPPKGKHWQYAPSKLDELDAAGDIHWSRNGNPRRKVYLTPDKRIAMTDYWANYRDAHHQSIKITGYPTEKNLAMLKMIVGASSNEGDLVIDPFCGSGTTMDAARELRRTFIGIDASSVAARATIGRMRNGLAPMGDFVGKPKKKAPPTLFEQPTDLKIYAESKAAELHEDELKQILDV